MLQTLKTLIFSFNTFFIISALFSKLFLSNAMSNSFYSNNNYGSYNPGTYSIKKK